MTLDPLVDSFFCLYRAPELGSSLPKYRGVLERCRNMETIVLNLNNAKALLQCGAPEVDINLTSRPKDNANTLLFLCKLCAFSCV